MYSGHLSEEIPADRNPGKVESNNYVFIYIYIFIYLFIYFFCFIRIDSCMCMYLSGVHAVYAFGRRTAPDLWKFPRRWPPTIPWQLPIRSGSSRRRAIGPCCRKLGPHAPDRGEIGTII